MTLASRLAALGLLVALPAALVTPFFQSQLLRVVIGFSGLVLYAVGVLVISLRLRRLSIFFLLIGSQVAIIVTVVLSLAQLLQTVPQLLPELNLGALEKHQLSVMTVQHAGTDGDEQNSNEVVEDEWDQEGEYEFELEEEVLNWHPGDEDGNVYGPQDEVFEEEDPTLRVEEDELPQDEGEETNEQMDWNFGNETDGDTIFRFGDENFENEDQNDLTNMGLDFFPTVIQAVSKFAVALFVVVTLATFAQAFGFRLLGDAANVHLFRIAGELNFFSAFALVAETAIVIAFLTGLPPSLDIILLFIFLALLQGLVSFLAFSFSLVGFFFVSS